MLSEEEKIAIEWLKNKPNECTNIINASSYIGNKKAYAKERTNFKTVLNLMTKLQKENEEKDKQIDLMVEKIYKRISAKELNKYCNKQKNNCKNYEECFNCIKQYFETKVMEGE